MATNAGDIQPTDLIQKRRKQCKSQRTFQITSDRQRSRIKKQKKSKSHNHNRTKDIHKGEKINNGHSQKITGEREEEPEESHTEDDGENETEGEFHAKKRNKTTETQPRRLQKQVKIDMP
jgi:hypothetical protein